MVGKNGRLKLSCTAISVQRVTFCLYLLLSFHSFRYLAFPSMSVIEVKSQFRDIVFLFQNIIYLTDIFSSVATFFSCIFIAWEVKLIKSLEYFTR